MSKTNILLYIGSGTGPGPTHHTLQTLKSLLPTYDIIPTTLQVLKDEPWEDTCEMIVVPGGRDLPFVRDLDETGLSQRVASWVKNGGKYIGFCAGAYFASRQVVFEPHRPLQVVGDRRMGLFRGMARGCCFPGFVYESEQGARAVPINVDGKRIFTYYNGGCTFFPDEGERFDVLATYMDQVEMDQADEFPSISLKDAPAAIMTYPGKGQAILSGVHVEYNGHLMSTKDNDPQLIEALIKTNDLRTSVLMTWFSKLGLRVSDEQLLPPPHTPLHLNGMVELPKEWKDDLYDFVVEPDNPVVQTDDRLIMTITRNPPTTWNMNTYLNNLTGRIGSCIMYTHTLPSTQTLLEKNSLLFSSLPSGSVVVASRQTGGRGRGRNSWIGLDGCLQFSMTLRYPRRLGSVVLIQYLMAVAVVQGIKHVAPTLSIEIKWPNDVYSTGEKLQKLSGILVNSSFDMKTDEFLLIVGCGINVSNLQPTTCIHSLLLEQGYKESLPSLEMVLASVLNKFDSLYTIFCKEGWQKLIDVYESLWMHQNHKVGVDQGNGVVQVTIEGLNQDGYLVTRTSQGQELLLGPDGNGFDMMKGLIVQKQ